MDNVRSLEVSFILYLFSRMSVLSSPLELMIYLDTDSVLGNGVT